MERWEKGPFAAGGALRLEWQRLQAQGRAPRRDFLPSGALEAVWRPDDNQSLSLAYTATARAPSPEERYAFGVHAATQRFEIGAPGLKPERSHQLELGYRFRSARLEADLTLFHHWVRDYVFFRATGGSDPESGLPVFAAAQEDAVFRGLEASVRLNLLALDQGDLDLTLFGDRVRGRLSQGGDVPRMPPLRYGMELGLYRADGSLALRLTRAEAQDHPGRLEVPTPAYLRLDVGGEYRLALGEGRGLTLFARGTNLLDQTIRSATSPLRTIAPEAGRGAEAGFRLEF
ncbi:TonB-dependent receptor [Methylomarinovum caldicuralii]|uniref:TonB-dependent receptor n=1 Tax=Methylomarinovum caldicuralii TaxID=438856 RepID=UPI0029534BE7|nr:TonB-dependent receptor [Methylomarinovum caldicuralii]